MSEVPGTEVTLGGGNVLQPAIEVSAEASQYLSMVYIVAVTDSPHSRPFPFSPTGVWSIGRQFSDKGRTRVGNTLIEQGLPHSLPYHITPSEACCPGTSDVAPELFAWADRKYKVRGEGRNFMVQEWGAVGAVGQLNISVDPLVCSQHVIFTWPQNTKK